MASSASDQAGEPRRTLCRCPPPPSGCRQGLPGAAHKKYPVHARRKSRQKLSFLSHVAWTSHLQRLPVPVDSERCQRTIALCAEGSRRFQYGTPSMLTSSGGPTIEGRLGHLTYTRSALAILTDQWAGR